MHAPACSRQGLFGLCAVVWAVTSLGGCANPDDAIGFQEQDPAARLRAIRQAAATEDQSAIPDLIRELESDDAAQRFFAIGELERMTGQTLGYDHSASREQRLLAAARWRDWYSHGAESTKKEERIGT